MSNVPLPEPDISVPFLSEVRKVPQGDYYRADKVLPLLKQWAVLYEAAKAGHEQAFAEAQNAAAVSAAKDAEIAKLRAELIKSLADNAALRAEVAGLREALTKIDAIRNDIIGWQKLNWSSHVYPLVAALDEAGFPGMEYQDARDVVINAARAAQGEKP